MVVLQGRTVTQRRHADGRQSQQQQLRNLADAEAETFDSEWKYEAQQSLPSYMRSHSVTLPQASRDRPPSALGW